MIMGCEFIALAARGFVGLAFPVQVLAWLVEVSNMLAMIASFCVPGHIHGLGKTGSYTKRVRV